MLLSDVPSSVSPAQQFRDVVRIVHAAEENGLTYVAIGQHFLYGDLRWLQPVPLVSHPQIGVWRVLCGGLDRHIEHHLYPNLPPNRLHALSPEIRALCRAESVGYSEYSSFWASAFKEVVVFTIIIPVLLWRSLRTRAVEEEE